MYYVIIKRHMPAGLDRNPVKAGIIYCVVQNDGIGADTAKNEEAVIVLGDVIADSIGPAVHDVNGRTVFSCHIVSEDIAFYKRPVGIEEIDPGAFKAFVRVVFLYDVIYDRGGRTRTLDSGFGAAGNRESLKNGIARFAAFEYCTWSGFTAAILDRDGPDDSCFRPVAAGDNYVLAIEVYIFVISPR